MYKQQATPNAETSHGQPETYSKREVLTRCGRRGRTRRRPRWRSPAAPTRSLQSGSTNVEKKMNTVPSTPHHREREEAINDTLAASVGTGIPSSDWRTCANTEL